MDAPGNEPSESTTSKDDGKSAVKSVADAGLPLEVGSIALGEDGHISRCDADRPLHFTFTACGIRFEAELADRSAPLRLKANLGKLPYTAESPEGRRLARSVIAATDRLGCGQIMLSDQQDMILTAELASPAPRTPVNVIATATCIIAACKPYLDLLGEAVAIPRPAISDDGTAHDAPADDQPADEGAAVGSGDAADGPTEAAG
ncbi:MAG TPA: hypothetical protein EYH07_09290 [Kiloniellaceae bacterium]|nr:hypothetical protein [Kiloniellaceae bacterium]HIP78638.1 hypothetical protein [Kiloniellaceae bacterium]